MIFACCLFFWGGTGKSFIRAEALFLNMPQHSHDEALTVGRAVAGLNAYSKGVSLGLFQPTPKEVQEQRRKTRMEETVTVDRLHRAVPAKHTNKERRAVSSL